MRRKSESYHCYLVADVIARRLCTSIRVTVYPRWIDDIVRGVTRKCSLEKCVLGKMLICMSGVPSMGTLEKYYLSFSNFSITLSSDSGFVDLLAHKNFKKQK